MKINKQTNFDATLNLPQETIPLDAKLTKKQGYLLESLQDPKKYKDAQNKNKNANTIYNISQFPKNVDERLSPKDIVNEIYKDVLIRYECMQGNLINHNIGFLYKTTKEDEENLYSEDNSKKRVEFQKRLHETIQEKIHSVRTLGTVMDYSKDNYSTISNDFSNMVIDKFYNMYKQGNIYLKQNPMHHCTKCGRYYGKNEVNYVKKKHINLYAMYRVKDDFGAISEFNNLRNTYVVATTAFPWTVACSQNLIIDKDATYQVVELEQITQTNHYIIQKDYVSQIMQDAFFTKYTIKAEITADELSKFILVNPMDYMDEIKLVKAKKEFVAPDDRHSTGIRVVVPEYSYIDFLTYKDLNLEIDEKPVVDKNGYIIKGNNRVIGKDLNSANNTVISYLRKGEFIFLDENIPVKVAECKECREELIYFSRYVFYMKTNNENINLVKETAKKLLNNSNFTKEKDKAKIIKSIDELVVPLEVKISDYSNIGVPIPLYLCDTCDKYFLDDDTVNLTKDYIVSKGITQINIASADDILKRKKACNKCAQSKIVSSNLVFNDFFRKMCIPLIDEKCYENNTNKQFVDILIESKKDFIERLKLLAYDRESIDVLDKIEKYIIHSDVSEKTKIIAKPIFFDKTNKEDMANAITTEIGIRDVSKKYGTDILRLWGVLSARKNNIILNEQEIVKANEIYKMLRKTIRYMLANLQDFNPNQDYIKIEERSDLDKYVYKKLYDFSYDIKNKYEICAFDKACKMIIDFCRITLSKDYFPTLKYRLYILDKNSKERLMVLSTMFDVFMQLVTYLEPIIPFTLEEAWQYAWHSSKDEEKNILMHRESISLSKLENIEFESKWDKIFKFVRSTNKIITKAIENKKIKNSLEGTLVLNVLQEKVAFLEENKNEIKQALNISDIEINVVENKEDRKVEIVKANGEKCARCRNYTMDIGRDIRYVHLCLNCVKILEGEK